MHPFLLVRLTLTVINLVVRGFMEVPKWGGMYGNSWRTTGDINDTWSG
jgi:hypothetical protein